MNIVSLRNTLHIVGVILLLAPALSGCGAISEGAWQSVEIKSEPTGARCKVSRDGILLGAIESTPGKVLVNKTFSDLRIECSKPGYADSLHFNRSEVAGAAIASFFFFGAAGLQIEQDAGAIRRYDDEVVIPLVRPGEAPKPLVVVEQARGPNGKQPRPALRAAAKEPTPSVRNAGVSAAPPKSTGAPSTKESTSEVVTLAPSSPPTPPQPATASLPSASVVALAPASLSPAEQPVEKIVAAELPSAPAPLDPYLVRRLENLKEIFDRKALTPAEYERKRATLMAGR
jgi:hypothetical protein